MPISLTSVTTPALFIGVVSHPASRYALNRGPNGLGVALSASVPGSVLEVCVRNFFDESGMDVNEKAVQEALSAELTAELRWARHLGRATRIRWWTNYVARWIKRFGRRLKSPGKRVVRRLLNIEQSHTHLLRSGLESGAPWVLILEDDADCRDVEDLAKGLVALMQSAKTHAFINLSDSFSTRELGITHLLSTAPDYSWEGEVPRAILEARLPATNTVCAIAYSRSVVAILLDRFASMPKEPVLPIDWKLNEALISLTGMSDLQCLFVEPAPILQMSMK
jgi:hypothetical protein